MDINQIDELIELLKNKKQQQKQKQDSAFYGETITITKQHDEAIAILKSIILLGYRYIFIGKTGKRAYLFKKYPTNTKKNICSEYLQNDGISVACDQIKSLINFYKLDKNIFYELKMEV